MKHKIDWTKSHCGLYKTPWKEVESRMPEVLPILKELEDSGMQYAPDNYAVDVKVHMLMPNQYPCIPNWHYDNVPRDAEGKQDFSKVCGDWMYLWVSNTPLTEFDIGGRVLTVLPECWIAFNQNHLHRGSMSLTHQWRCFIRVCPRTILHPAPNEQWLRRHSQVYLDAKNFKW